MASLRDIRTRIASIRSTQQITRAMKMVAAAKLRRAQERIFAARPYAYKLRETIAHIRRRVDPASHDLFQPREEVRAALLIVVTSDRGLAGAFNTNLLRHVEEHIRKSPLGALREAGRLHVAAVGRKGHEYFAKRGYQMEGDFRGAFNDLRPSTAAAVVDLAVTGFAEGRWDLVEIAYNEFKNTISQNRIVEQVLPVPAERFLTPVMEASELVPAVESERRAEVDYIFEPGPDAILDALVPLYLQYQVWRGLLESNAAEQGARMVAMDNATTNAGELLGQLQLTYNRARQAAITTEIIEISSGADALKAG
jgi:F-type H+-transporting ATPase subunit gamma